jgi:hypothetical protein
MIFCKPQEEKLDLLLRMMEKIMIFSVFAAGS